MAFLTFPEQLTEEEKLLQQKYQKLKRKKKQIQALKAPKVEPPPPPIPFKRGLSDNGPKADPKEVAKKLLKSGAIPAIKVPKNKDANFVRKRTASDRSIDRPGGYKPFSASESGEADPLDEPFAVPSDPNPAPSNRSKYGNLYGSFVTAKDVESIAREETMREQKRDGKAHYVNRDLPNTGNTVYIRGHGLTEASLRSEFSMCGTVVHVSIEPEKNCAFVTFESCEEANKSIDVLNSTMIDGVQVHIELARKQIRNHNSSSTHASSQHHTTSATSSGNSSSNTASSNSWTAIAANYYKEGRDVAKKTTDDRSKRKVLVYDDIDE